MSIQKKLHLIVLAANLALIFNCFSFAGGRKAGFNFVRVAVRNDLPYQKGEQQYNSYSNIYFTGLHNECQR